MFDFAASALKRFGYLLGLPKKGNRVKAGKL